MPSEEKVMDWIQYYYAFWLILGVCVSMYMHGDLKNGRHDFRVDFLAIMLSLPMIGRIFGWW